MLREERAFFADLMLKIKRKSFIYHQNRNLCKREGMWGQVL